MSGHIERLKTNLEASIRRKQELLQHAHQLEEFSVGVDLVIKSYRAGGRLYIAGNGGSAADAQHLATEFVSKLAKPRNPLPADALTTDTSTLTAIGNDYGFDEVFARQVQGKMSSKDIFLGLTTSGKSKNILRALEQCRKQGIKSITFTGHDGGPAKALSDVCVIAPGVTASDIQEVHMVLYHTLCGCVEDALT